MVAHVMIQLKPEDLPEDGLRVIYRCGELFEQQIEWADAAEGVLQAEQATNDLDETGINIIDSETQGYAGFEPRTGNYWRYKHESDPEVFREHCMQIIEIKEPFSPRSSWTAWDATQSRVSSEGLSISLKNAVTGTKLRYRVTNQGFSYQIKDLSKGRKLLQTLKHDFILNKILKSSFKKLDYHHVEFKIEPNAETQAGGSVSIHFQNEHYLIEYQFSEQLCTLAIFDTTGNNTRLLEQVNLAHSDVLEGTRTFLD
ncbi:MAG: hypothetical protein ACI9W6_002146 [Motiliproteus sp.]|jgi:hypothetical protein